MAIERYNKPGGLSKVDEKIEFINTGNEVLTAYRAAARAAAKKGDIRSRDQFEEAARVLSRDIRLVEIDLGKWLKENVGTGGHSEIRTHAGGSSNPLPKGITWNQSSEYQIMAENEIKVEEIIDKDRINKKPSSRKKIIKSIRINKKKDVRIAELLDDNEYKPTILKGKFQDQNIDKVDHIITDPPYSKEYLQDWKDFAKLAEQVLKPSGFLITYTGHNIPDIIHVFDETDLIYYHQFILIHSGSLAALHKEKINAGYKPIFVYQKPPFKSIGNYINNLIQGTGKEKDSHEWQQAVDELDVLINNFTDVNDLILDPFAGSGTVGIACKKNNRRSILIDDRI